MEKKELWDFCKPLLILFPILIILWYMVYQLDQELEKDFQTAVKESWSCYIDGYEVDIAKVRDIRYYDVTFDPETKEVYLNRRYMRTAPFTY